MVSQLERDSVPQETAPSKRKMRGAIFDAINRVASPGDVIFFISDNGARVKNPAYLKQLYQQLKEGDVKNSQPLRTLAAPVETKLKRIYRQWQGFDEEDTSLWHTAVYVGPVKDPKGSQKRPHFIHAVPEGVNEKHVPHEYFTNKRDHDGEVNQICRIEIVSNPNLKKGQRESIVEFTREQLGKPFAPQSWRHDLLTYAFGVPGQALDAGGVSCHGLAFEAYQGIGLNFPHPLENAPLFNIAKYIGHPLGHPKDHVDLRRLYIRDHHLYRDPRFEAIMAVFENAETGQLQTIENPGKYSWNLRLQDKYGLKPQGK